MKKEVDRTSIISTVIILLISFYIKTITNVFIGYRLSTENTLEGNDTKLFIVGVKPVVYINEIFIVTQSLMFYNYFQLIGSLFFVLFWFVIQMYNYINSFFHLKKNPNIYILNTINFILVFLEVIYLIKKFFDFRSTFIWINYERIGADVIKRKKLILKEKLMTLLKVYYSMLMITSFNVFIKAIEEGIKAQTVIELINHLFLLFIFYFYLKNDNKSLVILGLIFSVYVFIYSCIFRLIKDYNVLLPKVTYYMWSICLMFVLLVVFYYGVCNFISDLYDRRIQRND